MSRVYVVVQHGDKHHGECNILEAFESEKDAKVLTDKLYREQIPCEICGHKFWYTSYDLPFVKQSN